MHTDSSAALGIGCRRGLGKMRRVALNQLWVQDKVKAGEIELKNCKGAENPADVLTKHLDQKGILNHMEMYSADYQDSRHELAPEV